MRVRRVFGLLGVVAVAIVVFGPASLLVSASPVGAATAQEKGTTMPEQWADWDANGDDRLSLEEIRALSAEDFETLKDWVAERLNQVDDNDVRDWASEHFGDPEGGLAERGALWDVLGIPSAGVGDEMREIPGELRDSAGEVASSVVGGITDSAFDSVAKRVGEAAADLTGYIGDELARTGRPQLGAEWYQVHYQRMLGWAGLLLLPLALLAIGSAAIRGDTAKVGHAAIQVPIVYLLGVLAISAVSAASGLATAMSRSLVPGMQESSHDLAARITELNERQALAPGSLMLLGLLIAVAALVTLVWLILAEAAVYAVVLFIPLAFAGRVWEPAKDWGRKLLSIAFALVVAKVVVFAVWALAADGLASASAGDVPLRSALAIAALLLMTAISPSVALRFVPVLEGAGTAPSAGAGLRSAMSSTYYARGLRMGTGGRSGGRGNGLGVTSRVAGAAPRVPGAAGGGATGAESGGSGGSRGSGGGSPAQRPRPGPRPESAAPRRGADVQPDRAGRAETGNKDEGASSRKPPMEPREQERPGEPPTLPPEAGDS